MAADKDWNGGASADWSGGATVEDWTATPSAEDWAAPPSTENWTAAPTGTDTVNEDEWGVSPAADDWAEPPREKKIKSDKKPRKENSDEGASVDKGDSTDQNGDDPSKVGARKDTGYVNPNRVETGGQQRAKLSPEELAEKMEKIRLKNAQIKERREKIEADKQAFSKLMEQEDVRAKKQAQVQATVNSTRDENARIKLERQANRAWDVDKKVQKEKPLRGRGRGGMDVGGEPRVGRGRGRGEGRGRGRGKGRSRDDDSDPFETTNGGTAAAYDWGQPDESGSAPIAEEWPVDQGPKASNTSEIPNAAELPTDEEWGQTVATW